MNWVSGTSKWGEIKIFRTQGNLKVLIANLSLIEPIMQNYAFCQAVVAYVFKPSTWEAETSTNVWMFVYVCMFCEFKGSLLYRASFRDAKEKNVLFYILDICLTLNDSLGSFLNTSPFYYFRVQFWETIEIMSLLNFCAVVSNILITHKIRYDIFQPELLLRC